MGPDIALNRLWEVTLLLTEDMDQWLGDRGLTVARAALMWEVDRQGPSTQRVLSEALHVSPRNVTGLVDALEAGGFVTRALHPTDRRATLVTLTDRGRVVAAEMREGQQSFAVSLFGNTRPAELGIFISVLDQLLDRIRNRVSKTHGEPPEEGAPKPS